MAVSLSSFQVNGGAGSTTPTVTATSCVVGEQLALYLGVETNSAVSTFTDNQGGTWTKIASSTWGTGVWTQAVYVRDQLVATTSNHVISAGATVSQPWAIELVHLQGIILTGAAGVLNFGIATNLASGATPTVTMSGTSLTSSFMLGFLINSTLSASNQDTPPTGWTEDNESIAPASSMNCEIVHTTGVAVSSVTWGNAPPNNSTVVVLEIAGAHQLTANNTLGSFSSAAHLAIALHLTANDTLGAFSSTATANHGNRNLALNGTLEPFTGFGKAPSLNESLGSFTTQAATEVRKSYSWPQQQPSNANSALGENDLSIADDGKG